ncbi:conserved hypothetical protein [Candidatus Accumulibacter aalborgensis]|uniref:Uncharacterized protein n=1 Tax=Candidatus Accumulibacter aalborgensis TaxID=1860102 RepID=A0A1A8XW94_9PROT|nr:conserved hypothetical protein [Candidatus Accumulibacter aalborgensis]
MSIWLFVIYVLVGLVGWLWWTRMRVDGQREASGNPTPRPYRCVVIKPHDDACPGVRRLEGKRFLARAAPPLPLDDCSGFGCRCRYAHLADRRDGECRRLNARQRGLPPDSVNGDQRSGSDRRRYDTFASGAAH